MHRVDAEGATVDNRYTVGPPATRLAPKHLNAIQEELCRLVELSGLVLNDANNEQIYAAVIALITARGNRGAFVTIQAATVLTAANHVVYVNAAAGGFGVTLPDPAAASGCFQRLHRIDASPNNVPLVGTINGATDWTLNGLNTALTLHSDGAAWRVFA